MSALYGKQISSMEDEYILNAEKASEGLHKATIPGEYFLDVFPILQYIPSWVPGAVGKQIAEAYRPYVLDMKNKPFDEAKAALVSGHLLSVHTWQGLIVCALERTQARPLLHWRLS